MAMNFAIDWTADALNELAAVWNVAADQAAVTQASHRLELALARHPFAIGVDRDSSVNRTAVDLPLGIDYEIIEDDKTVRIIRVWSVV
jgi:hypothetical protein